MSETQQLELLARRDFVVAVRRQQSFAFWWKTLTLGTAGIALFTLLLLVKR